MLTIGSLFSGIGGLELGLEWAGLGPTRWQVEKEPKLRACLSTHWPAATIHEDIRSLKGGELGPVDLICGGFPCQDVSSAGKRAGLAGSQSGLWYEFARIVEECRPKWVVVENVASGASKWVDAVRGDLEQLGYATLPIPVAASDLGAPHRRARVFILGRSRPDVDRDRESPEPLDAEVAGASPVDVTHAERVDVRDESGRRTGPVLPCATQPRRLAANSGSKGFQERGVESTGDECPPTQRGGPCDHTWTVEPDVVRVVHGLSHRVDRIRALGNAVVPQCAEVVGWVIRELEERV